MVDSLHLTLGHASNGYFFFLFLKCSLLQFFGKSSQKMVEYLQSSVGIIHKNHAESITSFIKESVDEELKEETADSDGKPIQRKRLTFCVEGNISVGKTTFLQRIANETIELRDLVEIVPEPISRWQDVGPDHFNILDAFYAEPQRYAYTFQNYVFVTRVMQERESAGGIKPLRLMERSVFSDRMVSIILILSVVWRQYFFLFNCTMFLVKFTSNLLSNTCLLKFGTFMLIPTWRFLCVLFMKPIG